MWQFKPILKQTIWGGDRIASFKGIVTDLGNVGESWEVSGVEGSESVVADGPDKGLTLPELIAKYGASLMGNRNFDRYGTRFPLLIKFIDAREDLSVQVHPDDEMAQKYGEHNGKTEMWYVVDADKGAKLANGFRKPVNPDDYDSLVVSGEIENVLNFVAISPGETYFIPAGRVHAIGKGAFVAEIQQTSDATYRLYDYHRKDKNGNERELHTALAKEAVNFNDTEGASVKYKEIPNIPVNLVRCPMFTTNVLEADGLLIRDYSEIDSFIVIILIKGEMDIREKDEIRHVRQGETVMIPASAKGVEIMPRSEILLLETYLEPV